MNIFKLNQAGQSLLEITIVLGISIAVIIAITITTIQGLQSSQFSKNQLQATKLAQEGLELVRSMKESNLNISYNNNTITWNTADLGTTLTNSIWVADMSQITFPGGTLGCGTSALPCTFKIVKSPCCFLVHDDTDRLTPDHDIVGIFSRTIKIENYNNNPNQKKVTAEVTWNDSSGAHRSFLVTVLSNYEQ